MSAGDIVLIATAATVASGRSVLLMRPDPDSDTVSTAMGEAKVEHACARCTGDRQIEVAILIDVRDRAGRLRDGFGQHSHT